MDWLRSILLPYLKTCASYVAGGYAILILDQATAYKAEAVKAWLKKHRILLVILPSALTWRFQCVDVALAAKVKGYLDGADYTRKEVSREILELHYSRKA